MYHAAHYARPKFFSLSDGEIVDRVLAGDTALFEILMRRYNQRVYRVARSILHNEEEAEDVMQDAYVRAYTHLRQYARQASFSTWLTKIAVHEALARRRRRQRVVAFDLLTDKDHHSSTEMQGPQKNPEDITTHRELQQLLGQVIDALPTHHRTVFVLREVEGLSTGETAECLGISQQNVKVRLHRARATLRDAIERRIGCETAQLYLFHLSRCNRVVEGVFERIDNAARSLST